MKDKLNTRQWELYKLIKKMSKQGIWLNCRTIQIELIEYYPVTNATNSNNDTGIRLIKRDIQAINDCDIIQKVIISNSSKGYKLATKKDYEEQLTKDKIKILSMLKRNYNKFEKVSMNNQKRVKFNQEREFIESLLEN